MDASNQFRLFFDTRTKGSAPTSAKASSYDEDQLNKLRSIVMQYLTGQQYPSEDLRAMVKMSYRMNPDVYAVVNRIVSRAVELPWSMYELKTGKGGFKKSLSDYMLCIKSGNLYEAQKIKAQYWEPTKNESLLKYIEHPNKAQTFKQLEAEAIAYRLLTGNRYIYKIKPIGLNYATAVHILPSHYMNVYLNPGATYLSREAVNYVFDCDIQIKFNSEEVYHSKTFNPAMSYQDFLYGMSPIQANLNLIEKSNDSYSAAKFAYKNMGAAGFISQNGKTGEDGGFLKPDEAKELQAKFDEMATHPEKMKKMLVTSAAITWTNLGMSPVDLAIIDAQKLDREQICNIYGWPVQLLNSVESSTYDNMLQAERSAYLNVIIPEKAQFRDEYNEFIIEDLGEKYFVDFDFKMLPAFQKDLESMSKRGLDEVDFGAITRNQYRRMMGYEDATPQEDPNGIAKILINNRAKAVPSEIQPKNS